jgi:hypothetical protein
VENLLGTWFCRHSRPSPFLRNFIAPTLEKIFKSDNFYFWPSLKLLFTIALARVLTEPKFGQGAKFERDPATTIHPIPLLRRQ